MRECLMPEAIAEPAGPAQAARYESLIRLADAVRSQRAPDDLFGLLVDGLRRVVPFDAIAQFDETSTKVNWHHERGVRTSLGGEPTDDVCPLQGVEKSASVAWWVHEHQEPLVIPVV